VSRTARARQRFSLPEIRVRFASENLEATGQLANVSRAGLFVSAADLPRPGALATLQFRFAGERIVDVRGEVRWTTQRRTALAGPGFGVSLHEPGRIFFDFVSWLEALGTVCEPGDGDGPLAESEPRAQPQPQPKPPQGR
jgi:hypothetical protein